MSYIGNSSGWALSSQSGRDVFPVDYRLVGKPILPEALNEWFHDPTNVDRAKKHLHRYFARDVNSRERYTGQLFERHIARSIDYRDSSGHRHFNAFDFLAVQCLGVQVPPDLTIELLDPSHRANALLRECEEFVSAPRHFKLQTCEYNQLDESSPLSHLYRCLRQVGMGRVTTSKLLAARFPDVIPIRDSKVEQLLDLSKSTEWWAPYKRMVTEGNPSVWEVAGGIEYPTDAPSVTTLRKIDVILWMEARSREKDRQG